MNLVVGRVGYSSNSDHKGTKTQSFLFYDFDILLDHTLQGFFIPLLESSIAQKISRFATDTRITYQSI